MGNARGGYGLIRQLPRPKHMATCRRAGPQERNCHPDHPGDCSHHPLRLSAMDVFYAHPTYPAKLVLVLGKTEEGHGKAEQYISLK